MPKGIKGFQKGNILGSRPSPLKGKHLSNYYRPGWKETGVSYRTLHRWVERWKGKPAICEHCGKKKTTVQSIQWANKSGKYLRNLKDWISLCVPCHMKFDGRSNIINKKCKVCNKLFRTFPYLLKIKRGIYCSTKCKNDDTKRRKYKKCNSG